jgi:LDH2 family malate/lactate/ureidoglycolate dehydrogenase
MTEQTIRLPAQDLLRACTQLLEKVGVPADQASLISAVIVEADLRGIGSHGVLRLPAYLRRVQAGTMTARTELKVVRQRTASVLMDAQHGFGQVAGVVAMEEALRRAETTGNCFVGVRNAGHFGIAAYYAMMALPLKMIGVVSANAAPSMAPWGGKAPMLGTNPVCVAIPTGGDVDIVLDMASSVAARGKIRLAVSTGKPIPVGWALDNEGRPTEDPRAAMKGTLLPIGGPKGYGLALVIDILAGVLTGSSFGAHVPSTDQLADPPSSGFFVQALDIGAFTDPAEFEQDIQTLISEIRESPRARNVDRIYLPGEIEWRTKQERLRSGIPAPERFRQELISLGTELGVRVDLPRR